MGLSRSHAMKAAASRGAPKKAATKQARRTTLLQGGAKTKAMLLAPAKKTAMKLAPVGTMSAKNIKGKKPGPKKNAVKKQAMKARPAAAKVNSKGFPELAGVKAYVVNLERRADRWERVSSMLQKETSWLDFEKFPASDGGAMEIPVSEVSKTWNTKVKAVYAGCGEGCEWVFVAPGDDRDGTQWKWAADVTDEDGHWQDELWKFDRDDDDRHMATILEIVTEKKWRVKYQKSEQYLKGQTQQLSGGERGCAHSHFRLWKVAAERRDHTLVLEDDVEFRFERSEPKLGNSDGRVFTERLRLAMKHAPKHFDVIYLGWSGWRGGNFKVWNKATENGLSSAARKAVRRAEYVWTTVAYVISQSGAKKLLAAAKPLNMPVDEFMAAEACQGRLSSFVAMDKGDDDEIWAGGLVDQFDFQGDSDIKKSDGGVQGDSIGEFQAAGGSA